jgi:hypothetical protein
VVVWMLEMKVSGGLSCKCAKFIGCIVADLPGLEYNTVCG